MRARELLESISSVVFHATNFPAAVKILSNDMLRSKAEEISFTRSLQGSYHKHNKLVGIIFKLDGRKLNMSYKGGPVGTEDYDLDDNLTYRGKENKQLEDRIYSGEIKNFSKYIDSAVVYIPEEYLENYADEFDDEYDEQLKYAEQTIELLKSNGIEYRFVMSEKDLVNPRANDEAAFNKMFNPEQEPEEHVLSYSVMVDEGEYEPMFEYETIRILASSMDEAMKKSEEYYGKIAKKYNVENDAIYLTHIENDETGDLWEP